MLPTLLTLGIIATAYIYYKASLRHCIAMRKVNEIRSLLSIKK